MSTAVFFSFPGGGHVIPSLPILAELVRRGEAIHYFGTPGFRPAVEQTGAIFCDYGSGFPLARPHDLARFRGRISGAIRVQLEASRWVLDQFAAQLAASPPAYVMYDALASWGWYMAQTLRVRSIAFVGSFVHDHTRGRVPSALPSARVRRIVQWLYQTRSRSLARSLSARYRVPQVEPLVRLMQNRGDQNLVFTSREFQPNGDKLDAACFKFIGPSVTPRPEPSPFPFEQLDGRPLILISLGTVFNQRPAFYEACFRAFANTPWQVVMAVDRLEAAETKALPPNFIVRPFVPQLELLRRAAVFICHGGMNSVNESLYFNVPLVMVPQAADHPWIAARVAELGAGVRLAQEVDAAQLLDAVNQVLANPIYAQAAAHIGATLRATGGVEGAVAAILTFK